MVKCFSWGLQILWCLKVLVIQINWFFLFGIYSPLLRCCCAHKQKLLIKKNLYMFIHRLYCSFCTTVAYAFWYLFVFSYSPLNVLYSEIVQYESFKFRQKFVFCYPLRMFIKLLFACMFFSGCCNKLLVMTSKFWEILSSTTVPK